MKKFVMVTKLVKNMLNKQKEKFEDLPEDFLDELKSQSTIYLNNSNNDISNINEEEEKKDKVYKDKR